MKSKNEQKKNLSQVLMAFPLGAVLIYPYPLDIITKIFLSSIFLVGLMFEEEVLCDSK